MTQSNHPPVLRSAGIMGAATFLSRILGLVREQVFAFFFGAGNLTDAYNVAFRIPNLLRDLFAEGAMSASLVPVFTQTRKQEGEHRAWQVAGRVFRVLFVVVSLLALVGFIFAPELVRLYTTEPFRAVPGKFELTVHMTRIMFPFFPLVALAAAFMGILNACQRFFIPALYSSILNITDIIVGVGIVLILLRYGEQWGLSPIEGMAIGVVAGGLAQALSQLPLLYKEGYRWPKRLVSDPKWHQDPRLKQMLWMMIPGTVGLAATQINILVNTMLATSQAPGTVSWLNYAFRLMQFPIGIFGVSLAAATLPRISQQLVDGAAQDASTTLSQSLKQVFAINLAASAGLAFLGVPIMRLIFQYGKFTAADTEASALALVMYALGLTAYSAVKVLVPACYALGNTRVAVISSVLAVIVTVTLNLLMIGPFGYWGLALGTSLAAAFNAIFLLKAVQNLLAKRGAHFALSPLLAAFLRHSAIALVMGVGCWFSSQGLDLLLPDQPSASKIMLILSRVSKISLLVTEGVLIVYLLARLFRIEETLEAVELFSSQLKKKLSKIQK